MIATVLFYVFIAIVVVQLIYYIGIFSKFSFAKPAQNTPKKIPISVIVCAKNEAENVAKFIPLLLQQDYPDYELVLIDDASSDETLEIFEALEKEHRNIKLVKVENNEAFWGNKKFALTLGIKAAKNDYLLFTDADCYPTSNQWIKEMSSCFTREKTIVLGYGGYVKKKGSFLNKLIRYETLLTALYYFAWAKAGKPYMGVGRNLAYKREEFFKVNGFIDHMKIRSGDDDLFINQAATGKNTTICFSKNSFTYSEPKTTYKDWFLQKRRHLSTAKYYHFFDKCQLTLLYLTQWLFIGLAITLLVLQTQWMVVSGIIFARYLINWIVLGYAAAKLNEKDTIYFYPIIELCLLIIQFKVFINNLFSTPKHWK